MGGAGAVVQIHENFRRALACAQDSYFFGITMLCDLSKVSARMKHARIVLERREVLGNTGHAADPDDKVAGEPFMNRPLCIARAYAQECDFVISFFGEYFQDFFAISTTVVEMRRGPGEIIVEFVATWEEGLQVNEILQALFLMQVVNKRKIT